MIFRLEISLRAWHPNGNPLSGEQLVHALSVNPQSFRVFGSGQQWEAARIAVELSIEAYENTKEPYEAFANALQQAFGNFSKWLSSLTSDSCDQLRTEGMILDLLIGIWIDQNQLDLDLPTELFRELVRLRLPLKVLSND